MADFLNAPKVPTVSALPAAGQRGRMLALSTDGKIYYDNGTSWVDLTAGGSSPSGPSLGLITGRSLGGGLT